MTPAHPADPLLDANTPKQPSADDDDDEQRELQAAEAEQLRTLLLVFGPPFARTRRFWIDILAGLLMGAVCGAIALGFFNAFLFIAKQLWDTSDYQDKIKHGATPGGWMPAGPTWYIGMMVGGGACVGVGKLLWSLSVAPFPRVTPSLVTELKDLRVHDTAVSVCILIVSTLSLGFGASVGPEASLGAIGGSIGTIVGSSRLVRRLHGTRGARGYTVELYSLLGMAAAFGPLLPSPVLAVMLLHELGVASQSRAVCHLTRTMTCVAPMHRACNGYRPRATLSSWRRSSSREPPPPPRTLSSRRSRTTPSSRPSMCRPPRSPWGAQRATLRTPTQHARARTASVACAAAPALPPPRRRKVWVQHLAHAIPLGVVCGVFGLLGLILVSIFRQARATSEALARHKRRTTAPPRMSRAPRTPRCARPLSAWSLRARWASGCTPGSTASVRAAAAAPLAATGAWCCCRRSEARCSACSRSPSP